VTFFCGDFKVCMLGSREWTRIVGNFCEVSALNIKCDHTHTHEPWGFARDENGRQVWATSLESRYPRKMCIVLVTMVQFAERLGLKLKPTSILDDPNPLDCSTFTDKCRRTAQAGKDCTGSFRLVFCCSFCCHRPERHPMSTHV
jgi:hypothetical protein